MNSHLLPKYRFNRSALEHLALVKKLTDAEIAKLYGVSPSTISNRRHRWKIRRVQSRPNQEVFGFVTAEYLRERVYERKMTDKEIAAEAGCSDTIICCRRRRAGIKSAYQLGLRDRPDMTRQHHDSTARQIAKWPDLPPDAFKDVRTVHHGGRIGAVPMQSPAGLGSWS